MIWETLNIYYKTLLINECESKISPFWTESAPNQINSLLKTILGYIIGNRWGMVMPPESEHWFSEQLTNYIWKSRNSYAIT